MGKLTLDKVGSDVEYFLVDSNGKPVPCIGLFPGTKEKPYPILGGNGFAIQEDNVALEWNIPPAPDAYQFVYNLMRAKEEIIERAKVYGLTPVAQASMKFDPKQLQHEQALTAGCQSDYCAWDRKENEPVKLDKEIRAAGGHVHISFKVDDQKPKFPEHLSFFESIVMACDIFLGTVSVFVDKDKERRKFYGRAGAFRYKPEYGGVEYRTLSPFWTQEPKYMGWVFNQVENAFRTINSWGDHANSKLRTYKPYVMKVINEGHEPSFRDLRSFFRLEMP